GNQTGGAVKIQTNYGEMQLGPQNQYYTHIYTNLPKFYINKPIFLENGELSSYSSSNLNLQTAGTTRMTILNNNGNVGIGTNNPQSKFHIANSSPLGNVAGNYIPLTRIENNTGNVFLINDFTLRETNGTDWISTSYIRGISIDNSFLDPKTTLRSWIKQNPFAEKIDFGSSGKTYMSIRKDQTTQKSLLIVDGTIHAQEVIVDLNTSLADFVFHPNYNLMPLNEVEQFVKTNSHLPEIPSATEVSKNGMSIGEMQNKLLQKIEELTLYVIEQQKQIILLKKGLNQ
ncbi:MAG: hypothetical protein ACOYO1_20560, partial [Bacteroidales bacterium]